MKSTLHFQVQYLQLFVKPAIPKSFWGLKRSPKTDVACQPFRPLKPPKAQLSSKPNLSYLTSQHHESESISQSSSFEDFVEFPFFAFSAFQASLGKAKSSPLCWRRHISPLSNKRISNFASNIVMLFCSISSSSEILKSESFGWRGLHSACRAIATSSQYCLFNQLHFSLQNYTRCCTAHSIHYTLYFETLPLEPPLRTLRQQVRIEN